MISAHIVRQSHAAPKSNSTITAAIPVVTALSSVTIAVSVTQQVVCNARMTKLLALTVSDVCLVVKCLAMDACRATRACAQRRRTDTLLFVPWQRNALTCLATDAQSAMLKDVWNALTISEASMATARNALKCLVKAAVNAQIPNALSVTATVSPWSTACVLIARQLLVKDASRAAVFQTALDMMLDTSFTKVMQ